MKTVVALIALAGIAGVANAQIVVNEENGARLSYQVWNPSTSSWGSSVNALPGQQVEFRVVLDYLGTNGGLLGLGSARYQPQFRNFDNSGAGASADQFGAFRNNGNSGDNIANSMLSAAEGSSGSALASYGRVTYGSFAMQTSTFNTLTAFRSGGGVAAAPNTPADADAGFGYARLAGSSVTQWPLPTIGSSALATATNINNIARGVAAAQNSQVIGANPNTFWQGGLTGLVVFRGAIILSDDAALRTIEISTAAGSITRVGGANNGDDRRAITWQQTPSDPGSWRTSLAADSVGLINVVPTPASVALLGLGGLVAARRRRA